MRIFILFIVSTVLLLGSEKTKPEEKLEIRIVSYEGSDGTKVENRLFILGQKAYRSFDDIKKTIGAFSGHPEVHFVIYGTCDASDPRLSTVEIEELKKESEKQGVRFTYYYSG